MPTVAITGAARGIGFELAKAYSEDGARVYAFARDLNKADALKALAAQSGGKVTAHQMDVGNDESVRAAASALSGAKVDVLFNVAGLAGSIDPELKPGASNWADWQDVLNVNTLGPLRVLQAFLPNLDRGAKVINLSSQVGASTWPMGGFYSYAASKAALNRVMASAALDLKDSGIIVGLVHPGWVQTDMGGENAEITTPESVAGIRKITAEWTLDRSGAFLKWNGETHPW